MDTRGIASLLHGYAPPYLDHLAPLSSLLDIPLVVTDKEIEKQALLYYPDLSVEYVDEIHAPEYLIQLYKKVIVCTPRALFNASFLPQQLLSRKKIQTLWCPHGNSDKGHKVPFMEALAEEEYLLLYGKKMEDFLEEKGSLHSGQTRIFVGNFRKLYYEKHQAFYKNLWKQVMPPSFFDRPYLLYAPTWNDAERSSSYPQALEALLASFPSDYHLLFKPHPHLSCSSISHPALYTLQHFPPIYPILAETLCYIGDFSSIGYDFLSFNRPLLLFNPHKRDPFSDKGMHLHSCSTSLDPDSYQELGTILPQVLRDSAPLQAARSKLYSYTFSATPSLSSWKKELVS